MLAGAQARGNRKLLPASYARSLVCSRIRFLIDSCACRHINPTLHSSCATCRDSLSTDLQLDAIASSFPALPHRVRDGSALTPRWTFLALNEQPDASRSRNLRASSPILKVETVGLLVAPEACGIPRLLLLL